MSLNELLLSTASSILIFENWITHLGSTFSYVARPNKPPAGVSVSHYLALCLDNNEPQTMAEGLLLTSPINTGKTVAVHQDKISLQSYLLWFWIQVSIQKQSLANHFF